MKFAVLGTGNVGATIATKLISLGHDVRMGARDAKNEKAAAWVKSAGAKASADTFEEAAAFGELVVNCTLGSASLDALKSAGAKNLDGKVLLDIANPLDFSKGMPPSMLTPSTDSLAEQLQRAFPQAHVVKALNTMNCSVMVNPGMVAGGDHDVFMCGNDASAKSTVGELITSFGWKRVTDLGDLSAARATEMYVVMWVRMMGALKTPNFNIKLMR